MFLKTHSLNPLLVKAACKWPGPRVGIPETRRKKYRRFTYYRSSMLTTAAVNNTDFDSRPQVTSS